MMAALHHNKKPENSTTINIDYLLDSLARYPYNFKKETIAAILTNLTQHQVSELINIVKRGYQFNLDSLPCYLQINALLRTNNDTTLISQAISKLLTDAYQELILLNDGEFISQDIAKYLIDLIYESKLLTNEKRLQLFDHLLSQPIFDNWYSPSYYLNRAMRFFSMKQMQSATQQTIQLSRDDVQRQLDLQNTLPPPAPHSS